MRYLFLLVIFVISFTHKVSASEKFNDYENVVIGTNNLFGLSISTETSKSNGMNVQVSDFDISLFGSLGDKIVPRISKISIDVFGDYGISIGTGFMIGNNLNRKSCENNPEHTNSSLVLISPRIGYGISFSDYIGLWNKFGFTYSKMMNNLLQEDQVWIDINSDLVTTPISGISFTSGLVYNNMINQTQIIRRKSKINNSQLTNVGIQFGLIIYF